MNLFRFMVKKRFFYGFLAGVFVFRPMLLFAFEKVTILKQSISGESILLDKGVLEGVHPGDYALIYRKEKSDFKNPKYSFIAKIEAAKVGDRYSIWTLPGKRRGEVFGNEHLVMKRISQDSRAPLNIKRTQVIVPKGEKTEEYKKNLDDGIPKELIKIGHEYISDKEFQLTKEIDDEQDIEQDIEVRSYGRWAEFGSNILEKENVHVIYLGPESLEPKFDEQYLRGKVGRKIFADTLKESTDKINNLNYGLSYFYEDSLEDSAKGAMAKKKYPYYEYLKYLEIKAQDVDRRGLERLAKRDFTWSKNYSEAQLRKNFLKWGVANEIYQQRNALQKKRGHEINLRYTTGLGKHFKNQKNLYAMDSSFSLGHEFHLGATLKWLEHFTVEWEGEKGVSHEFLGGVKSEFREIVFHGYLYWYFYNSPDSLKRYLVYVGAGLKRGNATLYDIINETEYKFKVAGTPLWRFGIKYRFRPGDEGDELIKLGMGFNILLSSGDTTYSGFESKKIFEHQDVRKNIKRLSIGLNFYF